MNRVGQCQYQAVREENVPGVEVVKDLLDVVSNLSALIADELSRIIPRDARNIGNKSNFLGGECELVERDFGVLFDAQSTPFDYDVLFGGHYPAAVVRKSSANRCCSQAVPLSRTILKARVADSDGSQVFKSRMI